MSLTPETVESIDWSFATLTDLGYITEHTAGYHNPAQLRKGLVEETGELIFVEDDATASGKLDNASKEIGDVLWYAAEITRSQGLLLPRQIGRMPLSLLSGRTSEPIYGLPSGLTQSTTLTPRESLAIASLRVVDALNPQNPLLWPENVAVYSVHAVGDLVLQVARFGQGMGLTLHSSAKAMAMDLATRIRKPHVIESNIPVVASERTRLAISKTVRDLLLPTIAAEQPE